MHTLIDYVCKEMDDLERKAQNGKLSMAEMQYLDTLAHTKKNLLKSDEMMDEDYSMDDGYNGSYDGSNRSYDGDRSYGGDYRSYRRSNTDNRSYRGRKRDSMGRYARGGNTEMMVEELRGMMEDAPDDRTRQEFQTFIRKIEQM